MCEVTRQAVIQELDEMAVEFAQRETMATDAERLRLVRRRKIIGYAQMLLRQQGDRLVPLPGLRALMSTEPPADISNPGTAKS